MSTVVSGSKYDADLFTRASRKFVENPTSLSEDESAQLKYVAPDWMERVKQNHRDSAGKPQDDAKVLAHRVTLGELPEFMQVVLEPLLATFRIRMQEERVRVGELERRVKQLEGAISDRLEALDARPLLKDAGVWRHGSKYIVGDVSQHGGSAWICTRQHTAAGPVPDLICWRLWIKRAKTARICDDRP